MTTLPAKAGTYPDRVPNLSVPLRRNRSRVEQHALALYPRHDGRRARPKPPRKFGGAPGGGCVHTDDARRQFVRGEAAAA